MQTYKIKSYTRREGGDWIVTDHKIETTLEDLETALERAYYDAYARSRVTKIPQLPVPIHALLTDDMRRWDCIDGWS